MVYLLPLHAGGHGSVPLQSLRHPKPAEKTAGVSPTKSTEDRPVTGTVWFVRALPSLIRNTRKATSS